MSSYTRSIGGAPGGAAPPGGPPHHGAAAPIKVGDSTLHGDTVVQVFETLWNHATQKYVTRVRARTTTGGLYQTWMSVGQLAHGHGIERKQRGT